MQNYVNGGREGVTWPTFIIRYNFGTPSISRKLLDLVASHLSRRLTNKKNAKLNQGASGRGHVTYFEILGPLRISGTIGSSNFKFLTHIDHGVTNDKMQN